MTATVEMELPQAMAYFVAAQGPKNALERNALMLYPSLKTCQSLMVVLRNFWAFLNESLLISMEIWAFRILTWIFLKLKKKLLPLRNSRHLQNDCCF